MKDQVETLKARGIAAARLDSSLSQQEVAEVFDGMRNGTVKLLYIAPERLMNENFVERLKKLKIAMMAVDEAHCISEWGHNFRPDYLKLAETARALGVKRVLALTATATPAVVADICATFGIPEHAAVVTGFYRPNLFLSTAPASPQDRDAVLVERLHSRPPGPGIVYVTLQKTAERVATLLESAGLPARPYHAGMEDEERAAVQDWWKSSDRATVVATIAFGMGIDKADVRYVYHYNLPKSLESYSQEIGRAGRDGKPSTVEILGNLDDQAVLENFAYGDTPTEEALRRLLDDLLSHGPSFDVALMDLSNRYDIRPLVLRTALTYLELLGVIRQGTPFYAGYKAKPLVPPHEIVGRFSGERAQFIGDLFGRAKPGRQWLSFDLDAIAEALGQDRQRLVRALEYLSEQGLVELQASDARQRYSVLEAKPRPDVLTEELVARFIRREQQEIDRVQQVLDLVRHAGCQVGALLRYFGDDPPAACGHCSYCVSRTPVRLPPTPAPGPVAAHVDRTALTELARAHLDALSHPRQRARFLCGLTSPAITRAKLGRHPLFGSLEGHRFHEVLRWCESTPR
jgi:ATP-dependent DNA helicase RecQ